MLNVSNSAKPIVCPEPLALDKAGKAFRLDASLDGVGVGASRAHCSFSSLSRLPLRAIFSVVRHWRNTALWVELAQPSCRHGTDTLSHIIASSVGSGGAVGSSVGVGIVLGVGVGGVLEADGVGAGVLDGAGE